MKIVVIGGKGLLGREVVHRLEGRGATVITASRHTGVDLATGKGLEAALEGVDCVVHAATHRLRYRRVDLNGTRRLVRILANRSSAGSGPAPPHVIYVSIVGCDRSPQRFYRVKAACELVLERSGLPATVVRATQFHALLVEIAQVATLGRMAVVARGMTFQPCDHHWVAAELADIALGPTPSGFQRATDLAGPEQISLAEAVSLIRAKNGKPALRLITLPAIGGTLQAYAAGANLPTVDAKIGGASFGDFLESLRVGITDRPPR
jgi:uncharacterized protein YbjT (DUF2867 family)